MVEMLFHTLSHPAKNTDLEEKLAEISSCVTSPANRKEKEVISSLHGTLKDKNNASDVSPIPP